MYEVQGCVMYHDEICSAPDEEAEFFGVYFRGESGLAEWIEDFDTREEAENFVKIVTK